MPHSADVERDALVQLPRLGDHVHVGRVQLGRRVWHRGDELGTAAAGADAGTEGGPAGLGPEARPISPSSREGEESAAFPVLILPDGPPGLAVVLQERRRRGVGGAELVAVAVVPGIPEHLGSGRGRAAESAAAAAAPVDVLQLGDPVQSRVDAALE